jgi:hypothetical protein
MPAKSKKQQMAAGRACGEARETFEVISQRSVEANGEIDERKTIARIRENQTQKIAEKKAALGN